MTMLNENQKQMADETIRQLGGNQFIRMTGAKNFSINGDNEIAFKIGRNCKRVNYVKIKLNGLDLYDMTFLWVTTKAIKTVSEASDIYNDQIQAVFTKNTGLYTRLF